MIRSFLPPSRRRRLGRRVTALFRDRRRRGVFERLGAYDPEESVARAALVEAENAGFERLLHEHREAWGRRWDEADVVIDGDEALQRDIRFGLFHLMASVTDRGEAACRRARPVGRRLQGSRLLGQRRLRAPIPCRHASRRCAGHAGVPRPPAPGRRRGGPPARPPGSPLSVGVRRSTGSTSRRRRPGSPPASSFGSERASSRSTSWRTWRGRRRSTSTGPGTRDSPLGRDAELLAETARYWASRVRFDREGRAHIYGVIGPDEYHEPVDDNAFTNVMARWNLRRAAALSRDVATETGPSWLAVADTLVDGYDAGERRLRAVRGLLRRSSRS